MATSSAQEPGCGVKESVFELVMHAIRMADDDNDNDT